MRRTIDLRDISGHLYTSTGVRDLKGRPIYTCEYERGIPCHPPYWVRYGKADRVKAGKLRANLPMFAPYGEWLPDDTDAEID